MNKYVKLFIDHKKIVENYFFMTILQLLNSFFYLIIYPFVVNSLGVDNYGLYVFSYSIATYFITFVGFGFDIIGVRQISLNQTNDLEKSNVLSAIFTAKILILIMSTLIFFVLVLSIDLLKTNFLVFRFSFMNILSGIFMPIWYFQGLQKMRIVTFIQVVCKIASLPLILYFVKNPDDLGIYSFIISITNIIGSLAAYYIISRVHNIKIKFVQFNFVIKYFKDAMPYFWTIAIGTLKGQSVSLISGAFYSMKEVAYYDLAYKLVSMPNILLSSINTAMFPKIINEYNINKIKKIIKLEYILGLLSIVIFIIFGKWFVILFGGQLMLPSYSMSVLLSTTVLSWLVVGAYINFIFVPNNKSKYVLYNQLIALVSFFVLYFIGIQFINEMIILVIAMSLSSIIEIIYCYYIIRKKGFLKKIYNE